MSKVDIITTTYRGVDKLKECLSSVVENTKYVDYKWYVWANDPNDDVKKAIHDSMFIDDIRFNDRIDPIFNDTNDGSFSSNNNEAAEEGNSEYILFLNDDTVAIKDDWLLNMTNILDNDQSVSSVGSLLLYPDKQTIQHCGVFFSNKTNNLPFHMFYRKQLSKDVVSYVSVPRYYQAVTGACLLVRRKYFEDIGGFYDKYYYCYEDIDLCLHMNKKFKKKTVYCPGSVMIHNEGISSNKNEHMKHNIDIFKNRCDGMFFDDLFFYLGSKDYMVYKK
jgi:GT2 family glycosyltransferase